MPPFALLQDLYCVRSDLGNLLKALGRLDEAKVTWDGEMTVHDSGSDSMKVILRCFENPASL